MKITEQLESALHDFVRASDAAKESPSGRQMARRVIKQSTLVAESAEREGSGGAPTTDESESVTARTLRHIWATTVEVIQP